MIKLKNIYKTYISHNGVVHRALNNLSLDFDDKGLVVIAGKSGSGKTTLMNLIAGIDSCDRGEIIIENRSFKSFKEKDYSSYRNSVIGYVFQDYNLIDAYNVYENIKLSLSLQSKKDKRTIEEIMAKLEISALKKRKNYELSGGQKQRVAIARALIKDPKVILADEPSGALDEKTTIEIFEILKELSKSKLVIVITHDLELANRYGDRIIEIRDGQIFKDFANDSNQDRKRNSSEFIAKRIYYFPEGQKIEEPEMSELNKVFIENRQDYYLSVEQSALKVKTMFPELKEAVESEQTATNTYRQYIYQEKEPAQLTLKKSNLPFWEALKLSFRNIWKKKFSFLFLSIIAIFLFTLFGLSTSLNNYHLEDAYAYAIHENSLSRYLIESGTFGDSNYAGYDSWNSISDQQNKLINNYWQKTASYYNFYDPMTLTIDSMTQLIYIYGVIETDYFSELYNLPFTFKSNDHFADQNGIIISQFLADSIVNANVSLSTKEDLYDKEVYLSEVTVRVIGIYQDNYQLDSEFNYQKDTHLNKVFFKKNAYQSLFSNQAKIKIGFLEPYASNSFSYVKPMTNIPLDKVIEVERFDDNYFYASYNDLRLFLKKDVRELNVDQISDLIKEFNNSDTMIVLTANTHANERRLYVYDQIKISGFINDEEITSSYVSADIYENCLAEYFLPYKIYVERIGDDLSLAKKDVNLLIDNNLCINNQSYRTAIINLATIEKFEPFCQYGNMLIFILLVILLYFFLSLSIKKNRRQIGILRANGANFIDILKIFVFEAIIIGSISILGGVMAFSSLGNIINTTINAGVYTPVIFDTLSVYFQMVSIALAVILLALILPIIKITRTKIINLL